MSKKDCYNNFSKTYGSVTTEDMSSEILSKIQEISLIGENVLNEFSEMLKIKNFKDKIIMIYFFSKACVPCRNFEPILSDFVKEKPIIMYKMNCSTNQLISNQYKVTVVPTILFFLNGQLIEEVVDKNNKPISVRHTGACIKTFENNLIHLNNYFFHLAKQQNNNQQQPEQSSSSDFAQATLSQQLKHYQQQLKHENSYQRF